ncbi:MAG: hypothetical protein GXP39_05180 [Chloroflexi bacterium]|nr:hypothetical protein [Chloroflexota bacterium]
MFSELQDGFRSPPADARPWVRWWWFGNAVTREEIDRELRFIAQSGWGGVELQCVYAWPDVPPGPDTLSDAWFERVDYAVSRAAAHGLGFDLTFGSGWPFGGPHIPPEARVTTLRATTRIVRGPERIALDMPPTPGEPVISWLAAPARSDRFPPSVRWQEAVELDPPEWEAPDGTWAVTAVLQTFTGQQVKRAAPGGEGFVHDHLSPRGLNAHIAGWGEPLREHLGHRFGRGIRALFCDSWEVQGPYWTAEFLAEFQRRRGYDLRAYLPLLLGEWQDPDLDPALLADVRYDYRRTVAELAMDGFYRPFANWCREQGLLSRVQAHGAPADWIQAYGAADIPETEAILIPIEATRLAAAAARLYGHQRVTSESFTCLYGWPAVKMFAERPDDLKAIADGQFACGLQQIFYHGYAYSPPEAGETPGWYFYASSHINHTIPWRDHLSHLNDYLARISFLMQRGVAVTDLALYESVHDRWRGSTAALGPTGDEADMFQWPEAREAPQPPSEITGYTFDWVNDEALARAAALEGQLRLGEQTYHAIVLDRVRCLPLATAERLCALARAGVPLVILGDLPERVPGLSDGPEASARLRAMFAELLEEEDVPVYRSVDAYRAAGGLPPDVILNGTGDVEIWWAHRLVEGTHLYFLPHPDVTRLRYPLPYRDGSRRPGDPITLDVRFRVSGRAPQLWDAEMGAMYALPAHDDGTYTRVRLTFAPNQAHVIVFPPAGSPAPEETYPTPGTHTLPIVGPWQVTPPDGTTETWPDLRDWRNDPRLRDFSGTISYRATIDLPDGVPPGPIFLDLGRVEVVAEVHVNGEMAGVRLWAPYRVQVGRHLRRGRNEIEVRVSNLLYNAVQGRREREGGVRPIPGLKPNEWEAVMEQRLIDPVTERLPSGLFGPVQLRW